MPTTPNTARQELILEIKAAAEAAGLLNQLERLSAAPGKQFARSRQQRKELWLQLSGQAERAAQRLQDEAPVARKRASRKLPVAAAALEVPLTDTVDD